MAKLKQLLSRVHEVRFVVFVNYRIKCGNFVLFDHYVWFWIHWPFGFFVSSWIRLIFNLNLEWNDVKSMLYFWLSVNLKRRTLFKQIFIRTRASLLLILIAHFTANYLKFSAFIKRKWFIATGSHTFGINLLTRYRQKISTACDVYCLLYR